MFPGSKMAGIVYANIWGLPNIYVKADGTRFVDEGAYYVLVCETMFEKRQRRRTASSIHRRSKKPMTLCRRGLRSRGPSRWAGSQKYRRAGEEQISVERRHGRGPGEGNGGRRGSIRKNNRDFQRECRKRQRPGIQQDQGLIAIEPAAVLWIQSLCGNGLPRRRISINTKSQVLDAFSKAIPRPLRGGQRLEWNFRRQIPRQWRGDQ